MKSKTRTPRVLLCACGGIAAYKAVEVLRLLQKQGCEVRVAVTQDSLMFVGAATWEGLTKQKVCTSLYESTVSTIPHIELAGWADVVVVVPATANIMAKMAAGLADDFLSTTLLAVPAQIPVVIAPAMNTHMWRAKVTQTNRILLEERGVSFVLPVEGRLACEEVGEGKLASVEDIASAVMDAWRNNGKKSLAGKTILVTAGPTHEAIDPVRYIANASSGKMGYAIAEQAEARGAHVVLVSGPVSLECPAGVERVDVVSAAQMYEASLQAFEDADVAICAAAVADYTPAHTADHKLKKANERLDRIDLVQTADILAALCERKNECCRKRLVVGFAAETNDLEENAKAKLKKKGCDLVVANDVSRADSGFGSDTNHVLLVSAQGTQELPTLSKTEVAERLLDEIALLW
ncbi:MAG: bifunctional phosphopantothenoylcysteine decarboxylase/phosphopantothenate--cysteine ligase CoaBC [Coriobacteriales bacterium]|nr:bifunctional phosphopantothenoylcysteine decarboxylase/phosphopantothenate--cysteine ligase CoaBC [Coriobacteriales bacterium]